jgi:hypothetical protein
MDYETRTLKIGVCLKGEPTFHNSMTEIEIVDEVAGEFLEIKQCSDDREGSIRIDPYEWPTLKAAIDKMIKECRDYE